jgi:hypothetical protein
MQYHIINGCSPIAIELHDKIESFKHRLRQLHNLLNEKYPDYSHDIPSPDVIDIQKLGHGGCITTDTCNQAQKVQRLLSEHIPASFNYDCMNHLRNVWFCGAEKALTKDLNNHLQSSLDEIDPKLRVTAAMSANIRAINKEFSLSANYPKGHRKLFLEWIQEYHPSALLLHVERASGSRQDLCTEGSMAIYMNHQYYVEFVDNMLCKYRRKDNKPSIFQQNLFIALTSLEMITLSRLLSILHISVCMPFCWLAGKTHKLKDHGKDHGWGAMSMSCVIDTLYHKMNELYLSPELIQDKSFMMNIFSEYLKELEPFKIYREITFEKKQMSVIVQSCKDGSKVVHMAKLRNELFLPSQPTNVKTKDELLRLAPIVAKAICNEIMNENQATYKYTSKSGSKYSYEYCGDEKIIAFLGKKATNDKSESTLGGATANIQRYG